MKVAFVTNILTPYRMKFYSALEAYAIGRENGSEIVVYAMTDKLPLRPWSYDNLKTAFTMLLGGKTFYFRGHDVVINKGLRKEIRTRNYDVVVLAGSWTYPTVFFLSLFRKNYLKRSARLLFWYESHDNASEEFKAKSIDRKFFKSLKSKFMSQFDGFCVPGDFAKQSVSKFVNNKPYIDLRNVVDGDFYEKANQLRSEKASLRKKYGIDASALAVVMPARLIKLKGISEMLSRISDEIISSFHFEFVFAGEGDQKDIIKETAEKKGIRVCFLGYQSQESIRELLAACDYFCLSSLTDANPLSAIEAAWAGLPLLMSKYTGNYPELISEGVNGFTFDPLDDQSVNAMLLEAFSKSAEWKENASRTSVRIAREKFDADSVTSHFWQQLEKL